MSTHKMHRNDGYSGKGNLLEPSGIADSTVIWMHGLGDTAEGWSSGAFNIKQFPTTRFIFPTADSRSISLNMGMRMPGWFDISGLDPSSTEDREGVENSAARITNVSFFLGFFP